MAESESPLRALLREADLSPEQLARRLNRQASHLGVARRVDPKTPYKWLRGAKPRAPWPALLVSVLASELRRPVSLGDLGWQPGHGDAVTVPADSGLTHPWTPAGALAVASNVVDSGGMDRRVFLGLVGSALTEPAFEWLIATPAGDIVGLAGRRVQHEHVQGVEDITARLRLMDDRLGGGAVLDLVSAQIRHVLNLLKNFSYRESVGTRLHAAASELLRLAGWLSFDAGQHAQAQRYWLAALRTAHAAGDRAVGANTLGFMSCQAKDLGLHSEAIKLAEAAQHGYPGSSPRVATILGLRTAQAYAQAGDAAACRAAIDSAYGAIRDTGSSGPDPDWSYWMDEAQVNEQIGYCYGRLEDWDSSETHLRTSIRLQVNPATREGALRQALLALTYARQGEPEEACRVANLALDILTEEVDSQRCLGHVHRLHGALAPYRRLAPVAQLGHRVEHVFAGRA
jgi:tetratricopeptide (TPR) repeat protein